jgi:glycosyltransferase involved in cell wall biosynthesis
MLKILHIIPSLHKGGAERLVIDICNELQKREAIDVRIVTFENTNEYGFLTKDLIINVIPSQYIPSLSGKSIKELDQLQTFVDDFIPDIIHTHLWKAEIISRQICTKKVKWFSHVHDNMPQLKKQFFPCSKRALTNMYERFVMLKKYKALQNQFVCISKDTLSYIRTNTSNTFVDSIHLLPNAINIKAFTRSNQNDEKVINTLTLVTIGSLVNKKNQKFLIPVVQDILSHGISVQLHVLGDGENKTALQDSIIKNKLEQNILLHGNVDNVQSFLWNADIYVHSATYEPFGLVLLEAMAAGLPVVCLDGGGNRDIIENGKNGFMIKEQNPIQFADKIVELVNNQKLYTLMSLYAQEYAKKFDIKEYANKLLKLYLN